MLDLVNRFKEPSSWAGIATALVTIAALFKVGLPSDFTTWLGTGGALVASILAFFLSEKTAA